MQKVHLLDLVERVSSWTELEARISDLSQERERGETFEEFCKAFFLLDPVFQFEKVYRQNEIPPSLRQKLGYPLIQDIGIDGLAVTFDGKLIAYQAKFRSDRDNIPTLRELSTFFTVSDKADWRITITNANSLPSAINDRIKSSRVLADRFDQLDPDFFNRLRLYLKEKCIKPPTKKTPHGTQQEAVDAALYHFKDQNRGQLILPCGTGKTLAAMWIAEKIGGFRILIMVPSLALMSQTLREWAANSSIKPFRYLCLCSDPTVDLGTDSPIEHLYEMDIPVTTDVTAVSDFLLNERHVISILFSTYQSSKVLSEGVLKTDTVFDVGIFDEAHRTTGTKVGVWNLALDDKNVPIKKRVFMTATPRIYAPHIIKKAKEEDILICSMDDANVYGKPFYEMTFGKAIEENLITDYKVIIICVTDSEVKKIIQRGGRVITDDEHEWDAKAFAKRVALVKGINAYGLRKVFTFHGRVRGAKAFTDTKTPYGINQVFKMLLPENPSYPPPLERVGCDLYQGTGVCITPPSMRGETGRVKFFHVNGTMSSGIRNSFMKEFKEAEIGIMSNARCLMEGVDVPAVDTVAFIDPKKSIIDIVQATGRAMRKAKWKERGFIFIPVVVDDSSAPERFIESSDFATVWQVLQAMVDQDQRLQSIVSQLRTMQGEGKEESEEWKNLIAEYRENVAFYNLPKKIEHTRFAEKLYTKVIEVTARSWDFWYGLLLSYKKRFGDCNVPREWIENPQLGNWVSTQRHWRNKKWLNKERVSRLNKIDFIWEPHDVLWEEMFKELFEFKKAYGHCNIPKEWPENSKLAAWVRTQQQLRRRGDLTEKRISHLSELGFVWGNSSEEYWEDMFKALVEFKNNNGHCNVPQRWPVNQRLGIWVSNQRRRWKEKQLTEERIKRLNELGFTWDVQALWERMFNVLTEYKNKRGHCNIPKEWPENPDLATWVSIQRTDKYSLSHKQRNRLKGLGFIWDTVNEASWENMFEKLIEYKKINGHCNVPIEWSENPQLSTWVTEQRQMKNRGILTEDHIRRLTEIGFEWHLKRASWKEMFEALSKYKEAHGHSNVAQRWADNLKLATWVFLQRQAYKKGMLIQDRIDQLNMLGFEWDIERASWEEMFKSLNEYKNKHGHCNVPPRWTENPRLRIWVNNQRGAKRRGTLSNERFALLNGIGLVWSPLDALWEEMFNALVEYKSKYGHNNVPRKWIENPSLGLWVTTQRHIKRKGRLSEERIQHLDEIGFDWRLKDNKKT